jgi:CheY-like chemotaxis protein
MRSVIAVDSDLAVLQRIKALLEPRCACVVKVFTQPSAVLRSLATERPVLLTTSIMLPEFNGYELIRRIRTDPANRFPILIVSSPAAKPRGGLPDGVAEFIAKPFDPEALATSVLKLLVV